MTSGEGMVVDQTILDSRTMMADEGPLVFCNLPSRKSVSELEPSRMSYYNGNEHLAVPFKWEAVPGKPIVDKSQSDSSESPLKLRPPPSASNSPLQTYVPPPYKDQQKSRRPPIFRSHGKAELSSALSNRSSGHATIAESKGRQSEFDWPEASDDEDTTARTTDGQEPPSSAPTKRTAKNWSFSSSSFNSTSTQSQSPSPVSSGGGATGGGSTRDLVLLRNLVNFAHASPAPPANCSPSASADRSSTEGSDEEEREESNNHFRPHGFWACLPIFSKVRMISSQLSKSDRPGAINVSKRVTPGSKNTGYRPAF